MASLQKQTLPEGAHIGVYEIKRLIRTDSLGHTYQAWNEHLNCLITLKEYFPKHFATRTKNAQVVSEGKAKIFDYGLETFIKHAQALAEIEHPNIICVHNVLQYNGTAYMAMDNESGTPLASAPLKYQNLQNILKTLLDALQRLHANGLYHGDIHPKSILLRKNGQPLLIDFAATRLALAIRSDRLSSELRPGYAAPELYDNKTPSLTVACDLYALGATLYRHITHTEPQPAPKRLSTLNNGGSDPLPAIFELADPAINENILLAIEQMLIPDASQRPQSAIEVLSILDKTLHTAKTSDTHKISRQMMPFNHWIGNALAIAALLLIGFWLIAQKKSTPPAPPPIIQKPAARLSPPAASETQPTQAQNDNIMEENAFITDEPIPEPSNTQNISVPAPVTNTQPNPDKQKDNSGLASTLVPQTDIETKRLTSKTIPAPPPPAGPEQIPEESQNHDIDLASRPALPKNNIAITAAEKNLPPSKPKPCPLPGICAMPKTTLPGCA